MNRQLLVVGLLMEAGFVVLGFPGGSIPTRVGVHLALFGLYLIALFRVAREPRDSTSFRGVLVMALLFRVTLLLVPPFFSGDLYRYLWDGHVQVIGGLNPYLHAPAADAVLPLRNEIFGEVNHPEIPTIYPPVAQLVFALVAILGNSVFVLKALMVVADLATAWLLVSLLSRFGISKQQVLIYAWSPLVVAEVAGNGHLDALAAFLLVAAIHLIILERSLLSTVALGLSIGSKFLSLLVFPVLARRWPARYWGVPALVLGAVYLPYARAGPHLFEGLKEYGERWQHNDLFFTPFLRLMEWLQPTEGLRRGIARVHAVLDYPAWMEFLYRYAHPVYLARMLTFSVAVMVVILVVWKGWDPVRGSFAVIGAVLLLSPTVHPWYFLWILPFLALRPNRAWILLSGLVGLSYLDQEPVLNGVHSQPWIRWVEYLPFGLLLVWDSLAAKRKGGPVTLFGLRACPPDANERGEESGGG